MKPAGTPVATLSLPARRPYTPPRITFREPLEGVAALCGVTGKGDPVMCPTGPIAS